MKKINQHIYPLRIKKLVPEAKIPSKATIEAAGYDIYALENCTVPKQGKLLVATGISMAIPVGYYGRVAPRSGLAVKNFIDVGAGVIDSDYRGEVKVLLFNFNVEDFEIKSGDRIAQLIIERVCPTEILEVEDLDATDRGEGGFGSTGAN